MMKEFCCEEMEEAVNVCKVIHYDPVLRGYSLFFEPNGSFSLDFCPWCSTKLPMRLNSKIFQVIKEEYDILREDADIFEFTNVPDEFKTDEWWKKRGL